MGHGALCYLLLAQMSMPSVAHASTLRRSWSTPGQIQNAGFAKKGRKRGDACRTWASIFNTFPARDTCTAAAATRARAQSSPMPEDARRQQIRKQLAMPDIRAVSVFQSHLEQGLWRSRHIQALAADPKSQDMFLAIIECTKGLHAARRAPDLTPQQQQKLGSRNTLCLCHSTCPAETQVWMDCVRAAAKAYKENAPPPREDCNAMRKELVRCTRLQAAVLLTAAVVPPVAADVWPDDEQLIRKPLYRAGAE